jgi:hypothetical protein
VPEERCRVLKCQRCNTVTEERCVQVPYTTCRWVQEERVKQVPSTTCTMEPYCVTCKVCRKVPVCVPVCECPPCPEVCKPRCHEWLSRFGRRGAFCE